MSMDDNTNLILKGIELNSQGRYEEAIQFYDQALAINPNNKYGWHVKGDSLNNLGKYEEAITCYDFAISVSPHDDTWVMKGIVLNKINRNQEASVCYDKALSINPQNNEALTLKKSNDILVLDDAGRIASNKAGDLLKAKKYEEAIPYYEEAIKQHSLTPDSQDLIASLNSILAHCYYRIKKYEKSLTCVDKALLVDPINVDDLEMKSLILFGLEKHEEGLETITKALKIDPDNQNYWNKKGCHLFGLSKYEEAIFCYDKALELDPDKSIHLSNKGECLDKLSKYPESISCYERALEKDPNNEKIQKDLESVKAKLSKDSPSKTVEKVEVIEKNEPLDVLKMRLAKGEITLEEFNKIKENLV